jgi:hypothetical protein
VTQHDIQIYHSSTIDLLQWPETEEGQYAKKYLYPLIKNGARHYIDNTETEMIVIKVDDVVFPATINNAEYENSYVCSPYTLYVNCGFEKIETMQNRWLKTIGLFFLKLFKRAFRSGKINKIIFVNNWLFTTNLYPKMSDTQIEGIKKALMERYPDHAIAFRSITKFDNASGFTSLAKNKFDLIACRPVFFLDTKKEEPFKARMFKSDLKIFQNSQYEVITNDQIQKEDYKRILELYRNLYITKYTQYSPQLNLNFIELAVQNKVLNVKALRKNGKIDAVMGYFARNGVATSPIFGYDTSLPQDLGLYRIISTLLTLEAKDKGLIVNQSAGASQYKKLRRAESDIEYTAVYSRHLPLGRRLPWFFMRSVINGIGVPFMKYLDL